MIALSILTASALAADLHQCSVLLTAPDTSTHTVKGFGMDEAEARHSAELAGRILASQSVLKQGIQAWVKGTPDAQAGIVSTLAKGTKTFAVPGWSVEAGACEMSTVADGPSYTATWNVGSEELRRPTPALAIEASRRRACVPMVQRNLMQVVDEVIRDPAANGKLSQLDGAFAEFASCWTGTVPSSSPNDAVFPNSTTARCSAIDGTGSAVAVGFGITGEHAAEHATRQALLSRAHEALGGLAKAYVGKPPEERAAAMEPVLRGLVGLSGASDKVDRSRLACATVAPSSLTWFARGDLVKSCNAASWTERSRDVVKAADAAAFLDGTCSLQVASTFEIVRFASRDASPERKASLMADAYKVSGSCASACYRQATWGSEPQAVTLDGAPDRSSKKVVLASLKPLIDGQSLTGLELLPTLQDPKALGALLSGELSTKLKAEVRNLPNQDERWKDIDGSWILLPWSPCVP